MAFTEDLIRDSIAQRSAHNWAAGKPIWVSFERLTIREAILKLTADAGDHVEQRRMADHALKKARHDRKPEPAWPAVAEPACR
jgi:hypothetical protein